MSGDDRSERFKEESSGYGTHTSAASCKAPSEQSYQESINTVSSGIGSISSGTPRGSRKAGEFRAEKTGPESGNSGRHYEMDRKRGKRLEEMEERGKQQGAEDRQMEDRQMEDRQMDVLGQRDAHTVSVGELILLCTRIVFFAFISLDELLSLCVFCVIYIIDMYIYFNISPLP